MKLGILQPTPHAEVIIHKQYGYFQWQRLLFYVPIEIPIGRLCIQDGSFSPYYHTPCSGVQAHMSDDIRLCPAKMIG